MAKNALTPFKEPGLNIFKVQQLYEPSINLLSTKNRQPNG